MKVSFSCPVCGKQYHVSEKYRGKRGKCRDCKALLTVPERSGMSIEKKPAKKRHKIVSVLAGIFLIVLSVHFTRLNSDYYQQRRNFEELLEKNHEISMIFFNATVWQKTCPEGLNQILSNLNEKETIIAQLENGYGLLPEPIIEKAIEFIKSEISCLSAHRKAMKLYRGEAPVSESEKGSAFDRMYQMAESREDKVSVVEMCFITSSMSLRAAHMKENTLIAFLKSEHYDYHPVCQNDTLFSRVACELDYIKENILKSFNSNLGIREILE